MRKYLVASTVLLSTAFCSQDPKKNPLEDQNLGPILTQARVTVNNTIWKTLHAYLKASGAKTVDELVTMHLPYFKAIKAVRAEMDLDLQKLGTNIQELHSLLLNDPNKFDAIVQQQSKDKAYIEKSFLDNIPSDVEALVKAGHLGKVQLQTVEKLQEVFDRETKEFKKLPETDVLVDVHGMLKKKNLRRAILRAIERLGLGLQSLTSLLKIKNVDDFKAFLGNFKNPKEVQSNIVNMETTLSPFGLDLPTIIAFVTTGDVSKACREIITNRRSIYTPSNPIATLLKVADEKYKTEEHANDLTEPDDGTDDDESTIHKYKNLIIGGGVIVIVALVVVIIVLYRRKSAEF